MKGIIFGGVSLEHDISIISCFDVVKYIDDYILIYFDKYNNIYDCSRMKLEDFKNKNYKFKKISFCNGGIIRGRKKIKLDLCIELMHGDNGEDGAIKGFLRMYNIKSLSPSILNSSLFMDKYSSKEALRNKGFDVIDGIKINKEMFMKKEYSVNFPCIIKPLCGGSSIDIYVCKNLCEFSFNIIKAFKRNEYVIVEDFLEGSEEFNVGCSSFVISPARRVINKGEIFSFSDKYECEAKLSSVFADDTDNKVLRDIANKIYKAFNFNGIIRIDFLKYKDKYYVCEINTIPGGLGYYLFDDFKALLDNEINECLNSYNKEYNYEEYNGFRMAKFR